MAKPDSSTIPPSSLTHIELRYRNPSMGPHENKVSYYLSPSRFPTELAKLLSETRVNDKVTLGEYLGMLKSHDTAGIERVRAAYKAELSEGASIADLVFTTKDGATLELDDLRRFRLEGYWEPTFKNLVVVHGNRSASVPREEPRPVPVTDEERKQRGTIMPGDLPDDKPKR